ncbi:MAG: Folate-binding protein, partial [Pseudomonadota bacterium]|nr:Folate-binding protein [Pseudomonadota bacterium]
MLKEWFDFLEKSGGWVVDGRTVHFGHEHAELWTVLNDGDT